MMTEVQSVEIYQVSVVGRTFDDNGNPQTSSYDFDLAVKGDDGLGIVRAPHLFNKAIKDKDGKAKLADGRIIEVVNIHKVESKGRISVPTVMQIPDELPSDETLYGFAGSCPGVEK